MGPSTLGAGCQKRQQSNQACPTEIPHLTASTPLTSFSLGSLPPCQPLQDPGSILNEAPSNSAFLLLFMHQHSPGSKSHPSKYGSDTTIPTLPL